MFQKTLTGGRYNESNYPVQELWWKRGGGGAYFRRGRISGTLRYMCALFGVRVSEPHTCSEKEYIYYTAWVDQRRFMAHIDP